MRRMGTLRSWSHSARGRGSLPSAMACDGGTLKQPTSHGCPVGEAAEAMARSDWKKMGARNEDEALGIFNSSCTGRVGDAAGAA